MNKQQIINDINEVLIKHNVSLSGEGNGFDVEIWQDGDYICKLN